MIGWRIRRKWMDTWYDMCESARNTQKYAWRTKDDWRYKPILYPTKEGAERKRSQLAATDMLHIYAIEKIELVLVPKIFSKTNILFP